MLSQHKINVSRFSRYTGRNLLLLLFFFQSFFPVAQGQEADTLQLHSGRLKVLKYSSAAGYGGLLLGLNALWYKDYPQSSFHFFNDNREWMQLDKAGHLYSSFQLSSTGAEALQWAGLPPKKAGLYGSIGGFLFMLPIEILDGFAAKYGASWGDLAANGLGSLLYGGQLMLWEEVRIKPKFSFHPTSFAQERPNVLGSSFPAQLLKDYNGQTYWLSTDLDKFLPNNNFPCWLNLSLGYGTEGMVYAHRSASRAAGFQPYAQFYIGPELDLSYIRSKKRIINILLFLLDGIHLPAPALELSKNRIQFHPVYF